MIVRIVVADQAEARFYDMEKAEATPRLAGRLSDPSAHLHDREFKSDRPGRVFDHAPGSAGRRGSVAHHATDGERSPRKHEAHLFAQRVAAELEKSQTGVHFDRIVLMAGPAFLGELRAALPPMLRAQVVAEVAKDLIHEPVAAVSAHLPREAFLESPG